MADKLLLTPEEIREEIKNELGDGFVSESVIDEFIKENAGLLNRLFKAQLAKVLKHRLDRPELEEKIAIIIGGADPVKAFKKTYQILALIPTEGEIGKQIEAHGDICFNTGITEGKLQERERIEGMPVFIYSEQLNKTVPIDQSPEWQALKEGA